MSSLIAKVKVNRPELTPTKNHETDACYDLRADLSDTPNGRFLLKACTRRLIPTGVFVEVPAGFKTQIVPRSGLAANHGITILNSPGTIDADYRGEIKICLYNSDPNRDFLIEDCDRIAQMEFVALTPTKIEFVSVLSETKRADKGFGSSGVK